MSRSGSRGGHGSGPPGSGSGSGDLPRDLQNLDLGGSGSGSGDPQKPSKLGAGGLRSEFLALFGGFWRVKMGFLDYCLTQFWGGFGNPFFDENVLSNTASKSVNWG